MFFTMEKFKGKYRIPSARLQSWDYGSPGIYFITICTKNRKPYFGEIVNGAMVLNEMGKIAFDEWTKTESIRTDMNLELGEFVVMPNHFHGIVIIGENKFNRGGSINAIDMIIAATTKPATVALQPNPNATPSKSSANKFGSQSKNLASVIRGFKSSVTTYARKNNIEFGWQERFHDHIIRNHGEYIRISEYILNNPVKWATDKFNQ